MDLSESSILRYQLSSLSLDLLDIFLDFNGILPSDRLSIVALLALGVSDDVLKVLGLVKHHGLLALDHLGAHRVVKVGYLLEGDTFLVEFLSVLSHLYDVLVDFETHLS